MDHLFCPACGTKNVVGYKFCVKCGADISKVELPVSNEQPEEKTEFVQTMQSGSAAPESAAVPVQQRPEQSTPQPVPQPIPQPTPQPTSQPEPSVALQQVPAYEKTELVGNAANGAAKNSVNDTLNNIKKSLPGNKAVLIGAGALLLILVTVGMFKIGSALGGKGGSKVGKGGMATVIKAEDVINSDTEPEFNVPYINTSNGMVVIDGYCNEFLFGEYESEELKEPYHYKNGSNDKEFKSFTKGVDTIKIYDTRLSAFGKKHDEICVYSVLPIKIQAYNNGGENLYYYFWGHNALLGNIPIGDTSEVGNANGYDEYTNYRDYLGNTKEPVAAREVLYELFSRLCRMNEVTASVSREETDALYDKYKLDEWDLIKITLPQVEGESADYPEIPGYYKVNGNRLLVLMVFANPKDGYGFVPLEYTIDFDENDNLVIGNGDQTRTLENYTKPGGVLGACASGKRYQDFSQIKLYDYEKGIVEIEDKDFLQAEARLENITGNSISFSWDAGNDEYSIPSSGSASFNFHLVENCYDSGMPGMIIMDGDTKYFYLANYFTYWQQSLDAIWGDADIDVESLSENQVKELTNVKESIGEEMERLLRSSSISSDAYTIDEESGKIIFNEGILFDTGKSELKSDAYDVINAFSQIYSELYRSYGDNISYISVEGYADTTGTDEINIPLSQGRAEAVANAMSTNCEVRAQGFGSSKPIINDDGTENREASRRVELKIILKVQ